MVFFHDSWRENSTQRTVNKCYLTLKDSLYRQNWHTGVVTAVHTVSKKCYKCFDTTSKHMK